MTTTLKKLALAKTKGDHKTICLEELRVVGPVSFSRELDGHTIGVSLSDVTMTEINGQKLLSVVASVQRDGVDVEVNNPLLYFNPPLCVPDDTFSEVDGNQVANFVESPKQAMETIVFDTLVLTALKP